MLDLWRSCRPDDDHDVLLSLVAFKGHKGTGTYQSYHSNIYQCYPATAPGSNKMTKRWSMTSAAAKKTMTQHLSGFGRELVEKWHDVEILKYDALPKASQDQFPFFWADLKDMDMDGCSSYPDVEGQEALQMSKTSLFLSLTDSLGKLGKFGKTSKWKVVKFHEIPKKRNMPPMNIIPKIWDYMNLKYFMWIFWHRSVGRQAGRSRYLNPLRHFTCSSSRGK